MAGIATELDLVESFGDRLERPVRVVTEERVGRGVHIVIGMVPAAQAAPAQERIGSFGMGRARELIVLDSLRRWRRPTPRRQSNPGSKQKRRGWFPLLSLTEPGHDGADSNALITGSAAAFKMKDACGIGRGHLDALCLGDLCRFDEPRGELGLLEWIVDGEHHVVRAYGIETTPQ